MIFFNQGVSLLASNHFLKKEKVKRFKNDDHSINNNGHRTYLKTNQDCSKPSHLLSRDLPLKRNQISYERLTTQKSFLPEVAGHAGLKIGGTSSILSLAKSTRGKKWLGLFSLFTGEI